MENWLEYVERIKEEGSFVGEQLTYCWDENHNKFLCRLDWYEESYVFGSMEPPQQIEDISELIPMFPLYKCWGKGVKR